MLWALVMASSAAASAQAYKIRQADEARQKLDLMTAIKLYQSGLEHYDDTEAAFNLGECYRKISDIDNATIWFSKAARAHDAKPVYKLYYGMMLQAQQQCDSARQWFRAFLEVFPDDARGQFYARACDKAGELQEKNREVYAVQKFDMINSNLDDFSPTILGNQLVFASDRNRGGIIKRTSMWTGNPFSDLYIVPFDTAALFNALPSMTRQPQRFSSDINTRYNDAAVAVSRDSQTIYFTRNNFFEGKLGRSEEGLVNLKIFSAQRGPNGAWVNIQDLPFNSDEYHTAFPALSPDGRHIFFSSNKPGGYGGMDLYVCSRDSSGRWSAPQNLGDVINTEGNEIFPYMSADKRLYFASNGHLGLGRLDVFYSTQTDRIDRWNLPVNLGAPINSNADDFAITFGEDQSWGFFTSDRAGGTRDDIYFFRKSAAPVEILVTDAQTRKPLSNVQLTNVRSGFNMSTGPDGKIAFDLRYDSCAEFRAERKGYEVARVRACARSRGESGATIAEIVLQRQASFYVQGIVFDMTDGMPADGASIMLLNDCGKSIPEAVVTDDDGRFKFKLDKDCCYTLRAVQDGYIAGNSEQFCTRDRGYQYTFKEYVNLVPYRERRQLDQGARKPRFNEEIGLFEYPDGTLVSEDYGNGIVFKNGIMFDNGNPVMPEKTSWKRSETGFLIPLYYDLNAVAVNSASLDALDQLAETLQQNPELHIEIAAHTDARGSDEYNLTLSQQRADYVVEWLNRAGISRTRLVAKGYGETQLVNGCANDVPCEEAEHQRNRRTEFRVITKNGKKAPCPGCPF
jgi:outer membrane protein OmpA-like peptidoglycan-associated protein